MSLRERSRNLCRTHDTIILGQLSWLEQRKMPDRIREDVTVNETVKVTRRECIMFRKLLEEGSFQVQCKSLLSKVRVDSLSTCTLKSFDQPNDVNVLIRVQKAPKP